MAELMQTEPHSNMQVLPSHLPVPNLLAGETDTFEVNNCGQGNMSLRSKLSVLHDTLVIDTPAPGSPEPQYNEPSSRRLLTHCMPRLVLELPPPQIMMHLLQVFFEEHNPFFPCIDQPEFESRLLEWVSQEGYGAKSPSIAVPASQIAFAALLCMVFAVAEFVDPQSAFTVDDFACAISNRWYQEAVALQKRVPQSRKYCLDAIRFYTLEAMFLIDIEKLGEAVVAVATGMSRAVRAGLNDQTAWNGCSETENASRRALWWSLYYIDRRVAEKSGRPYCMRDIEVDVDDFHKTLPTHNRVGNTIEERSRLNLQNIIEWARLWGEVWDTFFALKAPKLGDQDEVEATDARIVAIRQRLPAALTWDNALFETYLEAGDCPRMMRYRLLTMTVRIRPRQHLGHG